MKQTLSPAQIFKAAKIPKSLSGLAVQNLVLDKKARTMSFTLMCTSPCPRCDVYKLKAALVDAYMLRECAISMRYENVTLCDEFLAAYKENVIWELRQKAAVYAYIFLDSEWQAEPDAVRIMLRHGCGALLAESKADAAIEKQFSDELSLSVSVEFIEDITQVDFDLPPIEYLPAAASQKAEDKPLKPLTGGVLVGKEIKGEPVSLDTVTQDSGSVIVAGDIISVDIRELREKKLLVMFNMTDYDNSITCKFFTPADKFEQIKDEIKVGKTVMVRGEAQYDKYEKDTAISVRDISKSSRAQKEDNAAVKRVELHLHTQYSAMDAVSSPKALIERAKFWGHKAIGITDHGVVQAFPDAFKAKGKDGIKVLYGVEAYLYDTPLDDTIVVFDIETTGLDSRTEAITEIGAVKVKDREIIDTFETFVNPGKPIPANITELTGITDEMVANAPPISEAFEAFCEFVGDSAVIAHNAKFDVGFMRAAAEKLGKTFHNMVLDTLELSRFLQPELKRHKLDIIASHLGIENENHHRAVNDATVTAKIWFAFIPKLAAKGFEDLYSVMTLQPGRLEEKPRRSYHTIIYAKDLNGLKNLYAIISHSHLGYFKRFPRVPKKLLYRYREGLIVGSACEAGELYRAILNKCTSAKIESIAALYDYLEIQPLGNDEFMLREGIVNSEEDLKNINRAIVKLGDKLGKLVCATCDVHFLDPKDEVFRRILMAGKGFSDADFQPPLYFRNTEDMLLEFAYLGKEKAYEVVVTNTNKIADMIEDFSPIKEGTYPPSIENSAEDLQRLCREKAVRIYGEPLPEAVSSRMEKELNPIIKYGFDVMYMIAQKLVKKSNDDGYIVGSRGSVGSSFVAFLSGITEVNSLPAHYICPNCKYLEFPEVSPGLSGCDLPDKTCPNCGGPLTKDGHDIPFETFLGFEGDKAPDIDLNFSGLYQAEAHKYTEVLFGKGHTFKAGTIGTIAEKTAYGFVKKYFDEKGMTLHNAEINRLTLGCTGVKRTTGQHPGGIIVLPHGRDIHEFTPVQHPADDVNSDIITTHFDYHSIHDNLLKLDILGHDDPTVIRMLQDLTGVDPSTISLDDKKTMSLFTGTEALGVTPEDIDSEVGTFAVPEFGTKFVRGMLLDTKPTKFSELVRISGLSHGTDVWLGNAADLIRSGTCTLSETICTRDDIMAYLISKGVAPKLSFTIMESVRKGKGLKPEWEDAMRGQDVPEWYIDSCKKIKYMFPKAHAVAYVTNAFRIAYFKVHHPLAFYIAYYTVRADDFNYELMTKGKDLVVRKITEIEKMGNNASAKDKNVLTILEVCREMYARGISFAPVDLYESDPIHFLNKDGKILPPLNSLPGLGAAAAENIAAAAKDGKFFSVDELVMRAKISKTVVELLERNGCLAGLPQSSQMNLFEEAIAGI